MNRPSLLGSLTLAAALVLGIPARAADKPPLDKLTVVLDWYINPDHGPLIVAKEKGFFAEAGLDVALLPPADPSDPPKFVAAGKADLGIEYQPQLLSQAADGLPLTRIGTLIDTPLNTVMALADGPVKDLKDLKGRKIGFSVTGFEDSLLAAMLGSAGLALTDVTLVNVNFNLIPALLSGQVDAVVGGYRNVEALQLAAQGKPARIFFPEDAGVPPYDELVIIANSARLDDPRLPRFLAAVERGALYSINHPQDGFRLFVTGRPELDDAVNRQIWDATLTRFDHSPRALDTARYDAFAAFMKGAKLIDKVPALASYAREIP